MPDSIDSGAPVWRDEIDSLAFRPDGHEGWCVIHRRAFRTLLGFDPTPQDCMGYFDRERPAFQQAALKKIRISSIESETNLHLNSRNIRRH
jgi:hypothetical protein